jgi:predicted HTH transcriptional regulator
MNLLERGPIMMSVLFDGGKFRIEQANSLADEASALGNSKGGVIFLGIDSITRKVFGIPLENLDEAVKLATHACFELSNPPLPAAVLRLEIPDENGELQPVVKIEVPKSLFVHQSPGGYFYRRGDAKNEMPPDILARLFQQRSQARLIRFEEQAVPFTSPADLDAELCFRFTTRSTEDTEVVLEKRNLLARDENGVMRASVAGVLLCSPSPERWLPGAFIEAVRYRGIHQDSNYQMDALKAIGPLDEQIRQTMLFLQRNQTVSATKKPHRVERAQFSIRAVFEAVVNAVAHRDYSIHSSKIRFFMFDDRLEIYSPGALPNTVTVESLPLRQATRNELITCLLAECPIPETIHGSQRTSYMEKRGDGVPIIMRESESLSWRKPTYRLIDDSELLLTIFAATGEP